MRLLRTNPSEAVFNSNESPAIDGLTARDARTKLREIAGPLLEPRREFRPQGFHLVVAVRRREIGRR
jgi:hypothetical protein